MAGRAHIRRYHILADDQISRTRLGIFDADRLVACLLHRVIWSLN
jgi:hypothetical protein